MHDIVAKRRRAETPSLTNKGVINPDPCSTTMGLRLHGQSGVITAAAFQLDSASFMHRMALMFRAHFTTWESYQHGNGDCLSNRWNSHFVVQRRNVQCRNGGADLSCSAVHSPCKPSPITAVVPQAWSPSPRDSRIFWTQYCGNTVKFIPIPVAILWILQ